MEQSHADQPLVVIDALDRASVQFELADDGGREVNPGGVQRGKGDRLVAGPAQVLQQPLLLSVSERHRPDYRPPAGMAVLRLVAGGRRRRSAGLAAFQPPAWAVIVVVVVIVRAGSL
jgi:hypothetical protein